MVVKACLFDLDGTLINSEDVYTKTISQELAVFNAGPLTWDVKVHLQGLPAHKSAEYILKHYGIAHLTTPEEFMKGTVSRQKELFNQCSFLPGVEDLLNRLRNEGVPLAVATSSYLETFKEKTSHLDFSYFDVIVTGDSNEIANGKPAPDIYHLALQKLNQKRNTAFQPGECLVFEDGVPGVLSGKAFGAHKVFWIADQRALDALGEKKNEIEGDAGNVQIIDTFVGFDWNFKV